jgi:hypothetical protein
VIRQENTLTISMGFNLQWNLGRNITSYPLLLISSSTIETWFLKSSWWLNNRAMQQFLFSMGGVRMHYWSTGSYMWPGNAREQAGLCCFFEVEPGDNVTVTHVTQKSTS